jgi:hypothetical protein
MIRSDIQIEKCTLLARLPLLNACNQEFTLKVKDPMIQQETLYIQNSYVDSPYLETVRHSSYCGKTEIRRHAESERSNGTGRELIHPDFSTLTHCCPGTLGDIIVILSFLENLSTLWYNATALETLY